MTQIAVRLGPLDHGRCMTLDEFDDAEVDTGFLAELGRGVVIVREVPLPWHLILIDRIRSLLLSYRVSEQGRIFCVAGGGECKLPIGPYESERHPDLAVYLTEPPYQNSNAVWSEWIPELVIEVVSPGSEIRDYSEKRDEYLSFGVREYWIVNSDRKEVLVLRRMRGQWSEQTLTVADEYAPHLLPGFQLPVATLFEGL